MVFDPGEVAAFDMVDEDKKLSTDVPGTVDEVFSVGVYTEILIDEADGVEKLVLLGEDVVLIVLLLLVVEYTDMCMLLLPPLAPLKLVVEDVVKGKPVLLLLLIIIEVVKNEEESMMPLLLLVVEPNSDDALVLVVMEKLNIVDGAVSGELEPDEEDRLLLLVLVVGASDCVLIMLDRLDNVDNPLIEEVVRDGLELVFALEAVAAELETSEDLGESVPRLEVEEES